MGHVLFFGGASASPDLPHAPLDLLCCFYGHVFCCVGQVPAALYQLLLPWICVCFNGHVAASLGITLLRWACLLLWTCPMRLGHIPCFFGHDPASVDMPPASFGMFLQWKCCRLRWTWSCCFGHVCCFAGPPLVIWNGPWFLEHVSGSLGLCVWFLGLVPGSLEVILIIWASVFFGHVPGSLDEWLVLWICCLILWTCPALFGSLCSFGPAPGSLGLLMVLWACLLVL